MEAFLKLLSNYYLHNFAVHEFAFLNESPGTSREARLEAADLAAIGVPTQLKARILTKQFSSRIEDEVSGIWVTADSTILKFEKGTCICFESSTSP